MANEQNLKHFTSEQSHDKAVENGRLYSGCAPLQNKLCRS